MKTELRIAVVVSLLLMCSIGSTVQAYGIKQSPLLGEAIFTEGIAYSEKLKRLFVGSAVGGSIQTINEKGKARWLQPPGNDGRVKALGLEVDDKRNRLWVVGHDAIYIYNLQSNELIKKNNLRDLGVFKASFLNDIVLDDIGNAYITDSFSPNLFKVDGETLMMSQFMELKGVPYGTINKSPWNLNGIVITPDQKSLLIAQTNDGSLWKVNLAEKRVSKLVLSKPVDFADGLTWGDQGVLYIVRNFKNQISKIEYSPSSEKLTVTDLSITPDQFSIPTTAVYLKGDKPSLIVVNSQFEQNRSLFFLTYIRLD